MSANTFSLKLSLKLSLNSPKIESDLTEFTVKYPLWLSLKKLVKELKPISLFSQLFTFFTQPQQIFIQNQVLPLVVYLLTNLLP